MAIKDIANAISVQNKRYYSGRKGVAKAVRRFMQRTHKNHSRRPWNVYELSANFTDCKMMNPDTYKPANWS